jgi:hypothetical protein
MALGQMFDTTLSVGRLTTPAGEHKRVSITIEGVNQTNAVNYNLSEVATGDSITSTFWNNLLTQAKNENTRRGKSATKPTLSTNISAVDYNGIRTLFNVTDSRTNQVYNDWSGANANLPGGPSPNSPTIRSFPATAAPSVPAEVSATSQIRASVLNNLINALNSAGQVCTCNCNYCTCNCNYCTCNCNYSCTCNCNY